MTVGGMRENTKYSVSKNVITLDHTRKFARKARDFMRAYRSGASTADVESQSRAFKTHRAMLDCFFTFVREENTD
jgi:hypothetical protein